MNGFHWFVCCRVTAADQSRLMQEQMTGAAMAMPPDPNKAFKVRRLQELVEPDPAGCSLQT